MWVSDEYLSVSSLINLFVQVGSFFSFKGTYEDAF